MKNIDLFKLSIVILFTALVIILFRYSQIFNEYAQNGRYYLNNDNYGMSIIDTRNGTVYFVVPGKGIETNVRQVNNPLPK